jgi:hypothetical protein
MCTRAKAYRESGGAFAYSALRFVNLKSAKLHTPLPSALDKLKGMGCCEL